MDQHRDPSDETKHDPLFVYMRGDDRSIMQRLAAIEQKLDALIREFGVRNG